MTRGVLNRRSTRHPGPAVLVRGNLYHALDGPQLSAEVHTGGQEPVVQRPQRLRVVKDETFVRLRA